MKKVLAEKRISLTEGSSAVSERSEQQHVEKFLKKMNEFSEHSELIKTAEKKDTVDQSKKLTEKNEKRIEYILSMSHAGTITFTPLSMITRNLLDILFV